MLDNLIKENFLGDIPFISANNNAYLSYIHARKPVIIKNLSNQWPAAKKWNLNYFRQKIDSKLNILVKDLSTNLQIPLNFMEALNQIEKQADEISRNINSWEKKGICLQMGQIITKGPYYRSKPVLNVLQEDFKIPDFVPQKRIMEINLWLNAGNVTTKLHYDPVDNLLTMITGRKEFIIFLPSESKYLYQSKISSVHSQIDVRYPDEQKFPRFKNAKYFRAILEPGDTLFLPQGHWHQVKSLDLNIALNMWYWPKWPHILELLKAPSRYFLWRELISRVMGKGVFEAHANDKIN